MAVADYAGFASALDDLARNESTWKQRGESGRAYVADRYTSAQDYVERLLSAVARMEKPLSVQMRERGLQRAQRFAHPAWQKQFAEFIENLLTQPGRPYRCDMRIEPLRDLCRVRAGTRTVLIPVRLSNLGTHAAVPDGPGRTVLCCEARREGSQEAVGERTETRLPALLMPGQAQVAAVAVPVPGEVGSYRLCLGTEGATKSAPTMLSLIVEADTGTAAPACAAVFLETVHKTLPGTHKLQQLPSDYVDVTEGRYAPAKRFVKQKLLNNFKRGYVDVLSRQQSHVNEDVVLMIQQLAECCAMLNHAVDVLHQRLDALEAKVEELAGTSDSRSEASILA